MSPSYWVEEIRRTSIKKMYFKENCRQVIVLSVDYMKMNSQVPFVEKGNSNISLRTMQQYRKKSDIRQLMLWLTNKLAHILFNICFRRHKIGHYHLLQKKRTSLTRFILLQIFQWIRIQTKRSAWYFIFVKDENL
jgi:hypothetical protein